MQDYSVKHTSLAYRRKNVTDVNALRKLMSFNFMHQPSPYLETKLLKNITLIDSAPSSIKTWNI